MTSHIFVKHTCVTLFLLLFLSDKSLAINSFTLKYEKTSALAYFLSTYNKMIEKAQEKVDDGTYSTISDAMPSVVSENNIGVNDKPVFFGKFINCTLDN